MNKWNKLISILKKQNPNKKFTDISELASYIYYGDNLDDIINEKIKYNDRKIILEIENKYRLKSNDIIECLFFS